MADWVLDVITALGYVGLFLLLVLENLFPPIPSEVVLPLAGFLVGRGDLLFVGAIVASTLGAVVGALVLYALGRWGGRPLVLRYGRWLRVDEKTLDRAEGWFQRWGDLVVLGARVVPLARSVISVPAGTSRMPIVRFTVLTTIGSAIWNTALVGMGYSLGANWGAVSEWVGRYSDVVLVVLTVATGAYLFWWGIRGARGRRREKG